MKIRNIICVLIAVLVVSCIKDPISNEEVDPGGAIPSLGKVNVNVSVALPQPEPVDAFTRADNPYTDTEIRNIDVLLFDKDARFLERIKVETDQLQATAAGVDFTVQLDATAEKRTVHIVVNGRTVDDDTDRLNFNTLTTGMSETAAISSLQTASLASVSEGESTLINNVMPLLMWGRFVLNDGINAITKVSEVKLLRATACIQVKKGTNANSGLDDFVIERMTVHNAKDRGYLAPSNCTGEVTTPTVGNPAAGSFYLDYSKGWVSGEAPSLYVYERDCDADDYMSVLIEASYKGKKGYYKVVMTDGMSEIPMDVIRNHRYIITIVGVNGAGYADIATAIASAPSNALKVQLLDDNEDYPYVVADGQYQMASTNNVFHLYGQSGRTLAASGVEICRVYSSRGIEPVLTIPEADTWLTNLTAQPLGGNEYQITGDFSSPSQVNDLATTLTMTCDNLSLPVAVNWNSSVPGESDTDSYVFDVIYATDQNWNVRVIENWPSGEWISIHPTASEPADYPGPGMMTELSSEFGSHAYIHVQKGTGGGAILKTSLVDGEIMVDRIAITQ